MTWRRVEPVDEYDGSDGRRAILVGDQVVVVSQLAAAILDALPATESAVGNRLIEMFGAPLGRLDEVVAQALEELESTGLVNKSPTAR